MARTAGARGLTPDQKAEIIRRAGAGETYVVIAASMELAKTTVSKVARKALGYREPAKAARPLTRGGGEFR